MQMQKPISEVVSDEWRKKDPYLLDSEGFEAYCISRIPQLLKEHEKLGKKKWDLLWSMFERPVVYDGLGRAWVDTLPKWVHGAIMMERLIQVVCGEEGKATDAEVVAHLYTASMARAIPSEFVNIYCSLVIKCMERFQPFGTKDYSDVKKTLGADRSLSNQELDELERLKRQLWDSGMRASEKKRAERRRRMKQESK